ncbi:MAG: hypothetical protein AAFS10_25335 [Myxococcota bacterium]
MARCQMYVGRLISHPCGLKAKARCASCGQPFCRDHLVSLTDPICLQCAGRYTPPDAHHRVTFEEMFDFDEHEIKAFERRQADADLGVVYDS